MLKCVELRVGALKHCEQMGLILCAEGSAEQVELLQLQQSGIRAAEYLTELPDKKILKEKLHRTIEQARKRFENK